jgi:hypothetical protein
MNNLFATINLENKKRGILPNKNNKMKSLPRQAKKLTL